MNKELEAQGFKPVCEARDCYNEYGNNNYDALNELEWKSGIFAYATDTKILYIGMSYKPSSKWDLKGRTRQLLLRSSSSYPMKKMSDEDFSEILDSSIYALVMEDTKKQEIEDKKDSLVEQLNPKFNSPKTKEEKA